MLTVQQFRSQYGLSESQFKRVRSMAELAKGSPVTARQGSKTWVITDLPALLNTLNLYDGGSLLPTANSQAEPIDAEFVAEPKPESGAIVIPQSSITVLNPNESKQALELAARYRKPVRSIQSVQTNGTQNDLLQDVQNLQSAFDSLQIETKSIKNQTAVAAQNLANLDTVLGGMEASAQALVEDYFAAADQALAIDSEAQKKRDRAEKLRAFLQA